MWLPGISCKCTFLSQSLSPFLLWGILRIGHAGKINTQLKVTTPQRHRTSLNPTGCDEGALCLTPLIDFQSHPILPTYSLRCNIRFRQHFFNWCLYIFHRMLAIFHLELSLVCFSSTDQNVKSNKLCRNSKSCVISQYAKFRIGRFDLENSQQIPSFNIPKA